MNKTNDKKYESALALYALLHWNKGGNERTFGGMVSRQKKALQMGSSALYIFLEVRMWAWDTKAKAWVSKKVQK